MTDHHKATIGCPITAGIFAWIAANAADEAAAAGERDITPNWRTLKSGGELNPKYPGGIPRIKSLLEAEGHTVVTKGQRHFVANYEAQLIRVPKPRVAIRKTVAKKEAGMKHGFSTDQKRQKDKRQKHC